MLMDKFEARIIDVRSKRDIKDDITDEYHKLTLSYEFNSKLARNMNLGDLGVTIQTALATGKLISARLPVPTEGLTANFKSIDGEEYKVRGIKALSASAKSPNKEDPNPTLSLVMNLAWDGEESLCFFNNHLTETVEVVIDKEQTSLPGFE